MSVYYYYNVDIWTSIRVRWTLRGWSSPLIGGGGVSWRPPAQLVLCFVFCLIVDFVDMVRLSVPVQVTEMTCQCYDERLQHLGSSRHESCRNRSDLTETFEIVNGHHNIKYQSIFYV